MGQLQPREDSPGVSPPRVSGKREQRYFDVDAALHEREILKMELGWLGRFLGGPSSVATFAALVIVIGSIVVMMFSVWKGGSDSINPQFWTRTFDASLGAAGTALGFLFGRGTISRGRS